MNIRIRTADKAVTATLLENATAREFAALLPLVLTLEEYAQAEMISNLPKKLTTEGSPSGSAPSAGDIAYYAPVGQSGDLLQGPTVCERAGLDGFAQLERRAADRCCGHESDDRARLAG
jgi:hypothetical protein